MQSKFTGGVLGYIGVSLAMGFLTSITLGFGLPWALCFYQSWLTEHTYVDGHQLTFDGKGGQLFGSYIKWFLLCIITLGIYSFWLPIKMQQWIAKHTHMVAVAE